MINIKKTFNSTTLLTHPLRPLSLFANYLVDYKIQWPNSAGLTECFMRIRSRKTEKRMVQNECFDFEIISQDKMLIYSQILCN